jgi:hypothetical protein
MSSSTNRSIEPTPIQAGGRPATLATRAGTAATGTLDEPAGTPSSELQAKRLALAVQNKVANGRRRWTGAARSVVQLGADEQLEDDGDFVAVARVNRKARCMAAARALRPRLFWSDQCRAPLHGREPISARRNCPQANRDSASPEPAGSNRDDAVAICRDPLQPGNNTGSCTIKPPACM